MIGSMRDGPNCSLNEHFVSADSIPRGIGNSQVSNRCYDMKKNGIIIVLLVLVVFATAYVVFELPAIVQKAAGSENSEENLIVSENNNQSHSDDTIYDDDFAGPDYALNPKPQTWHGLIIGVSTENTVRAILGRPAMIEDTNEDGSSAYIYFDKENFPASNQTKTRVEFHEGVVVQIESYHDDISLSSYFSEYGRPDYVTWAAYASPEVDEIGRGEPFYRVLVYEDEGVILRAVIGIDPTDIETVRVVGVIYYLPVELEGVISIYGTSVFGSEPIRNETHMHPDDEYLENPWAYFDFDELAQATVGE